MRNAYKISVQNLKGRYHFENLDVVLEVVDWIPLAQDRERWRAVVNTVMNLRFP
jgi:hypothetical protein